MFQSTRRTRVEWNISSFLPSENIPSIAQMKILPRDVLAELFNFILYTITQKIQLDFLFASHLSSS